MKIIIIILALYQTLATIFHLPGGWIMFTNVERLEWHFRQHDQEINWHPYVMNNYYILNRGQVRKLARFMCLNHNIKPLDIYWHDSNVERINECQ